MEIKVTKLTDLSLLQKANSFTTGKESHMTLARAYRCGHTTERTQVFSVECYDIPQSVAYHLRTHFTLHAMPPYEYGWMKSKRPDRCGADMNLDCNMFADNIELLKQHPHDVKEIEAIAEEIRELPKKYGRDASTDFFFTINATGLKIMAAERLCTAAAKETREVVQAIIAEVTKCDPDLAKHCVRPCVHCGFCREAKPCGFMQSEAYMAQRADYLKLFE